MLPEQTEHFRILTTGPIPFPSGPDQQETGCFHAEVLNEAEAMLSKADAVFVGASDPYAVDHAEQALRFGKPVLLESYQTLSITEASSLVMHSREAGVPCYTLRQSEPVELPSPPNQAIDFLEVEWCMPPSNTLEEADMDSILFHQLEWIYLFMQKDIRKISRNRWSQFTSFPDHYQIHFEFSDRSMALLRLHHASFKKKHRIFLNGKSFFVLADLESKTLHSRTGDIEIKENLPSLPVPETKSLFTDPSLYVAGDYPGRLTMEEALPVLEWVQRMNKLENIAEP
ncbi:MAG TPA: hypothetical protein PLP14_07220 [Chitinophagaceae bacterium]|nr:hypothetical protein [Chitinophagaceae bacterium]